jgi:uncharacterized membrane protein
MSTSSSNPNSDTGLPSNLAAGLIAIFTLLGGVVFYFIEKKDQFVRHWAVQGIFFGGSTFVVMIVLNILLNILVHIPIIGLLFAFLLGLLLFVIWIAYLVLWIIGIVKAFQGQRWEYPFISAQCKKLFPKLA